MRKLLVFLVLVVLALVARQLTVSAQAPPPELIFAEDLVDKYIDLRAKSGEGIAYAAYIRRASWSTGVPRNILAPLVQHESNFNRKARSRCNALGATQLTYYHWKGIDPLMASENIMRGAQVLRDNYKHYGSWDKALAAYNAGGGNLDKWIEKGGDHWRKFAFRETRVYLHRVLGDAKTLG